MGNPQSCHRQHADAGRRRRRARVRVTVRVYSERADGSIRSAMRRSEALLTLGVMAARHGELDAAVDYGLAELGDARKSAPSLLCTAANLDAALDGTALSRSPSPGAKRSAHPGVAGAGGLRSAEGGDRPNVTTARAPRQARIAGAIAEYLGQATTTFVARTVRTCRARSCAVLSSRQANTALSGARRSRARAERNSATVSTADCTRARALGSCAVR